ncbi:MAG: DUF1573 domain-containing protein [Bacteroidota bacterium]
MKRILILALFVFGLGATLSAQVEGTAAPAVEAPAAAENGPKMSIEAVEIDFGTIEQDSDPIRIFKITNTGDEPLLITNARGSCGCTTPQREDWNRPIAAGETRDLRVRYDTHRIGPFRKRVTLTHNAGTEPTILTIKGKVEPKATEPDALPAGQQGIFNQGGGQ